MKIFQPRLIRFFLTKVTENKMILAPLLISKEVKRVKRVTEIFQAEVTFINSSVKQTAGIFKILSYKRFENFVQIC